MNALKPRLKEFAAIEDVPEFGKITEGFKRAISTVRNSSVFSPTGAGAVAADSQTNGSASANRHSRMKRFNATSAIASPLNLLKVPVSGYTGHRMGYRSQNFYGKS